MSFVQPQKSPSRQAAGIGAAVLFHIVLVWALMNGLAHKIAKAIAAPLEARIIEEVKPPPPPPKVIELPPPPKFAPPPPPAYAPPPEIQVTTPTAAPITTTAVAPPESPPVVRSEPPKPAPAPAPAAPPAPVSASVVCANYSKVMGDAAFPRAATRLALEEGDALIQFTLTPSGEIRNIRALRASHPVFADNSIRLVSTFKCVGQSADVIVQVPFAYKSE